jgi:2-polyprenyl-6-methoxyphenol hydroxylase-like FAD-dependent oxidoreductase
MSTCTTVPPASRSVLVVGAGIGGLATAIALRQRGHEVHVVERQPTMHQTVNGVGIIQPMNALRALDAIGCADACLEQGFAAQTWGLMLDQDGNLLGDVPGAVVPGVDFPPMNGITRPRLHRILTDRAAQLGVTVEYDNGFVTLEETAAGVEVELADGSRRSADLVVGADGVLSAVRRHVLDGVEPSPLGQSAFRVPIPREPEMDRIILQDGGPAGMAGIVPIAPDLAYLFLNVPEGKGYRPAPEELRGELKARLAGFGGITGHVRDAYIDDLADEDIVLRPEEFLIVPAPWHKGRVVLIGDAVHAITPHLGQGAAQAIVDGVVLAECLGSADDLEEAFRAYAERRYERCRLVVETSVAIGEWEKDPTAPFDHVGITQRVMESLAAPL